VSTAKCFHTLYCILNMVDSALSHFILIVRDTVANVKRKNYTPRIPKFRVQSVGVNAVE